MPNGHPPEGGNMCMRHKTKRQSILLPSSNLVRMTSVERTIALEFLETKTVSNIMRCLNPLPFRLKLGLHRQHLRLYGFVQFIQHREKMWVILKSTIRRSSPP